ncbi:MAG: GGDEF domain-containing protein [Thermodesulfobacteriota bacterium]|nr:GGDEF domain-containing protein [Thermodesulfobacteriota bacterium]
MADIKDKQIFELNLRIKKLQSQKNALLKEFDEVEEQFENNDKIYRKYFPYIIDLMKDEKTSYSRLLADLSMALKKGDSFGRVEYILKQVKEKIFKENPDSGSEKKEKTSFFSAFFSSSDSGSGTLDEFKQGYSDIINSLKSDLGTEYIVELTKIESRITSALDFRDLSAPREDLFSLLHTYISDVTTDREKIAQFVKDIVQKILEIESGIGLSHKHTDDVVKSSEGFGSFLKIELGELKNSLDVAKNLEELKTEVSGKLSSIGDALKKKTAKDKAIKNAADKNRHAFKSGFAKLKNELEQAIRHSKELEIRLNHDPLTKAFNRRAYDKRINEEMERFLRYGTVFSLLMIDADHFKKINDNYGHAIGDKCLQELIKRTSPLLRKNDMLARYGGEEFVIIMPETDGKGAEQVAEKIRQTIEDIEFIYKEDTVRVTVSIGASEVKQEDSSHIDLFNRADTAVYQAKEGGRNRVVLLI